MGGTLRWQTCTTSDFPLKRSKVIEACQPCRTKKMRCDGNQPCSRCTKDDRHCEYKPSPFPRNDTDNTKKKKRKYQWSKLSFHQDLYAALNPTARNDKLPPLLFEFYHLTAQPITIWTRLHLLFQKWYRQLKPASLKSVRIPSDLAKEAVDLFLEYNTLYSLFIDPEDITIDPDSLYPCSHITASTLLLDTILALTFLAAGQSLGSDLLLVVARCFYDTVHQRWITLTFPFVDTGQKDHLTLLTQTALLLVHFQCTDICEEQAYMTCRIAHGCMERLLSLNPPLDDQTVTLHYTLHAWQVWFALYLYGDQVPSLNTTALVSSIGEQQLWTWSVLTSYTPFLASLLKSNQDHTLTTVDMMTKSQSLLPRTPPLSGSEQILGLYHATLTLQLYSSQYRSDLQFFTSQDSTSNDNDDCQTLCIDTSHQIIHIAQRMTPQRSSGEMLFKYRALSLATAILVPDHIHALQPIKPILDQDSPVCALARQYLLILQQHTDLFPTDDRRKRPRHHIDKEQLKKLSTGMEAQSWTPDMISTMMTFSSLDRHAKRSQEPTDYWLDYLVQHPHQINDYMIFSSSLPTQK